MTFCWIGSIRNENRNRLKSLKFALLKKIFRKGHFQRFYNLSVNTGFAITYFTPREAKVSWSVYKLGCVVAYVDQRGDELPGWSVFTERLKRLCAYRICKHARISMMSDCVLVLLVYRLS